MSAVSLSNLENAIGELSALDEKELVSIYQRLLDMQPKVFDFVMGSEDLFDFPEDFSLGMQYVVILWKAFEDCYQSVPPILEDELDGFAEQLAAWLESAEAEWVWEELNSHPFRESQPLIIDYVHFQLIEDEEEGLLLGPTSRPTLEPMLLVVAQCLHQAVHRPRMWVV